MFSTGTNRFDPLGALIDLIDEETPRIARLWAKRLKGELQELAPGRDVRAPLQELVDELARLLRARGEDALWLWPEILRAHGVARYDQRFDVEDLAREVKVFQQVLLRVYARRHGTIEPEVAELIAELAGEASAAMHSAYARVLRTEEVRFREAAVMESVLHHVEVGILVIEADATVSYATPPVTKVLGLPVRAMVGAKATDALGMVLTQINARHTDGSPFKPSDMPFLKVLKDRRVARGTMLIDRFPGREEVVVEMTATPLFEDASTLSGVIQTIADRTETTKKTRELTKAYDELQRLHRKLVQRTRAQTVGQLAAGAAHALNNFLNVIGLRVAQLRKDFRPEHLDTLERTVKSVGELVQRLQDFSLERAEEQVIEVDLDRVVAESIELVRAELSDPARPVAITTSLAATGAKVRADVSLLREVVIGLFLGAKERMPKGGRLFIGSRIEGTSAVVRVEDDGEAIQPDDQARLFDPLKAKTEPEMSLLMAVGRGQVQRWGGALGCTNRAEGGVSCEVRFPLAGAETHAAVPAAPPIVAPSVAAASSATPARAEGSATRVLVVDDDLENARVMAEVLQEEGYQVSVANDAKVALQLWDADRFDVALLDAIMPDMSGWDLAREIRTRSPKAAVAMVTGTDVRGQSRATLAQCDAVFRKPVDIEALDEFLQNVPVAVPAQPHPPPH